MAYNSNYGEDSNELVYDLRQKYAEIIGGILEEIAVARKEHKFKEWFNWLRNLRIEINQKLTPKERERYKEVLGITIKNLNRYSSAYLKTSDEDEEVEAVIQTLSKLDMWLKDKMEKHKMYGSKDEDVSI